MASASITKTQAQERTAAIGDYRVIQAGRYNFFIEEYRPNLLGLFPKWRSLRDPRYGGVSHRVPFVSEMDARLHISEMREYGDGPKVVVVLPART